MAIRNRHGIYDKFIPEKLVPGEFAFVRSGDPNAKDGKSIYASFDAGTTKRLATYEDMKENIALAAEDVVNEVSEELHAATDRANTSADEAETAADDAAKAAEEAKHAIAGSKSPVYKSDGWPEVGEEGRLYIDDTVSPRLIYTWDDVRGYVPTGGSGGGGNATVEEMTWAEYEALSEEEKMDGTLRVITDRKAGVRFGNVDISDIGDGTVTGAISAINGNLTVKVATYAYTTEGQPAGSEITVGNIFNLFNIPETANVIGVGIENISSYEGMVTPYICSGYLYIRLSNMQVGGKITFYVAYQ